MTILPAEENSAFHDFDDSIIDDDEVFDDSVIDDDETRARQERDEMYAESRGGVERCLNCGRYKYGDQLDKYSVCLAPCRNPREF